MSCDCFVFVQETDEFRMWQGLVGPYYTPAVDSIGNLSWTNNGNLVNPPTVNVSGRGLTIVGIVDTAGDLPESAPNYTVYLVGTTSPYHAYIFDGTTWTDLGVIGKGDPGATGPGVPAGGSAGQVLKKKSATDYDTGWKNDDLSITGASVGDLVRISAVSGGRPTVFTKVPLNAIKCNRNLLDNWYFVGGGSQDGDGKFPINQRGATSYTSNGYAIDRWKIGTGFALTVNETGIAIDSGTQAQYTDFKQSLPNGLAAGKYVVSALINVTQVSGTVRLCIRDQNNLVKASTAITGSGLKLITVNYTAETLDGHAVCILKNNAQNDHITANLIAIKLELGSTQTLAHQENGAWVLNEIPDYETELLRCKTSTADPADTYANGSVEFGSNIGIVQNTNTATQSIQKEQYVIWHGALYTASAAIASGATLSGSNLTAVTGGGLNDVGGKVSALRNDTALIITTRRWNDSPFVNQVVSLEGGLYLMTIDSRNMSNGNYTGVYIVEINTGYNSHITTLKAPVTPIANASVNKGTLTITPVYDHGFASIVKLTN